MRCILSGDSRELGVSDQFRPQFCPGSRRPDLGPDIITGLEKYQTRTVEICAPLKSGEKGGYFEFRTPSGCVGWEPVN